jgi:hypothetical protein
MKLFLLTHILFLLSCHTSFSPGYMVVKSDSKIDIPLEIYQIKQESPLQLTSEIIIYSNKKTAFEPGTYLVLADCSNEQITIRPGETVELQLSQINFLPPKPPSDTDFFSVQCNRHRTGMFRQTIEDRFRLNILKNAKSALVSMSSTVLEIPEPGKVSTVLLSAIRVKNEQEKSAVYFVSSSDEKQAVTKGVQFGSWQFLMPGAYDVSVNGTTQSVNLAPNQSLTLETGHLEVKAPAGLDIERIAKTRGYPYQIQLGSDHYLSLNETYPVLPGPFVLHLDSSTIPIQDEILVGETKSIKLRSIEIDWGCEQGDAKCVGRGEIMLYKDEDHFPFIESISDIPVLFHGDNVKVGISGSRDIRYNITPGEPITVLKTGKVLLKPIIQKRTQFITDLIRFEAAGPPSVGVSLDILPTWKPYLMTFIAGRYKFVQSATKYGSDGERTARSQIYQIHPGSLIEIEFPYLVSESQYEKLVKSQPKSNKG